MGRFRVDFSACPVELPWWEFGTFCINLTAISACPGVRSKFENVAVGDRHWPRNEA